jgi:hypothetical protein
MSDYDYNIYYNPEKSGLTIVAEIEYSSGCYEFDTRVVWKNEKGELFTARDSGCSCPTPFETFDLSNIDPVKDITFLKEEMKEDNHASENDKFEFIEKVKMALKEV